MAIPSWSLVRVYGTWTDAKGNMLSGTYITTVGGRQDDRTIYLNVRNRLRG